MPAREPSRGFHGVFWNRLIGLLVLLTCIRVWIGPSTLIEPARAQIPDSGLQRKLLLEEARRTNQLLTDIKEVLEKHTLNVRIQGADNQADKAAKPGDRGK